MATTKKTEITNAGKGVEKREVQYAAGGGVNWCGRWETVRRSHKKWKYTVPPDPAIPTHGYLSKENEDTRLKTYVHPNIIYIQ